MALTWNDLFLSGSIVNLTTSNWTGREGITPADLGIEASDAVDRALSLGNHRLVRAEAFAGIHGAHARARRAIDQHSLPFGFIWGARYVPEAQLASLSKRLRECMADFDREVAAFVTNYENEKAEMLPLIEKALKDAAKTPEAAAAALERLKASYPSPAEVSARFAMRWNIYAIQGARTAGAQAALEEEGATVRMALTEMISGLREEIAQKLNSVIALIKKGGKLEKRSIESANAVLDRVDAVNVLGDDLLTKQVRALRSMLAGLQPGEDISEGFIEQLGSIRQALEDDLADAAKAAEEKLTGFGRRLMEVA